jgi:hypothetical protein
LTGLNLYIDYNQQQLEVASDDNSEISVCFPTVKETVSEGKTVIKSLKEKNWDYYSIPANTTNKPGAARVSIPLASVNSSKITYMEVVGDKTTTPVLLRFDAAASKLRVKYTAAEDYASSPEITVTSGKTTLGSGDLEFRTKQGRWTDFDEVDFKYFTQQGAELYIREKAVQANTITNDETGNTFLTGASQITLSGTDARYTLYQAGSFASTEVKLKIKKRASAPSASVKYSKDGFIVKKGCEYRFRSAYGTTVDETWTTMGEDDGTFLDKSDMTTAAAGVLEVRLSEDSGKPSKINTYEFDAIPKLNLSAETTDATTSVLDNSVVDAQGDVTLKAVTDKGILKLNNTSLEEYYVLFSTNYVSDAKQLASWRHSTPGAKIKSGKSLTLSKYKGKYVYVCTAANDKEKKWQSDYVLLGKVPTE